MGSTDIKSQNECFERDYRKLYDEGSWNKDKIAMMKDLKKLIYYNLVIEAMENGGEYPGSEYMPEMSFRRGRNPMNGQFMSRDMAYGGYGNMGYGANDGRGSGMYYPQPYGGYGDGGSNGGGNSGANNGGGGGRGSGGWDNSSGRRYYDSEKEKAIHKLHHMMENTDDAERKNALKIAITELESK